MPTQASNLWLRGLLALAPLGAGAYLLAKSTRRRVKPPDLSIGPPAPAQNRAHHAWLGWNRETASALGGAALLAWSFGGGRAIASLGRRRDPTPAQPRNAELLCLPRPDGSEIYVARSGNPNGRPIVFVHGLGADKTELYEIRERLAGTYRLIEWDLPGLGQSKGPSDGDHSLEKLARDLEAVLSLAGEQPAVLVGHSLGGLILLTFCRLFPEALGPRVAGLVLAHTTYTNPVKTSAYPGLYGALQKTVTEPILHLGAQAAPLVRVFCTLCYLNGSAHRILAESLFTGKESWDLLDHLADYYLRDDPAVVARIAFSMLRCDETATLSTISIPTLLVAGDRDDTCTPDTHRFMAERIPHSQLLTLSPAKHGGILEYPDEFAQALIEFCERLSPVTVSRPTAG